MIIDIISIDELEEAGFDEQAKQLTAQTVESFEEFLRKRTYQCSMKNRFFKYF